MSTFIFYIWNSFLVFDLYGSFIYFVENEKFLKLSHTVSRCHHKRSEKTRVLVIMYNYMVSLYHHIFLIYSQVHVLPFLFLSTQKSTVVVIDRSWLIQNWSNNLWGPNLLWLNRVRRSYPSDTCPRLHRICLCVCYLSFVIDLP